MEEARPEAAGAVAAAYAKCASLRQLARQVFFLVFSFYLGRCRSWACAHAPNERFAEFGIGDLAHISTHVCPIGWWIRASIDARLWLLPRTYVLNMNAFEL